jgi:BlaI family penicillinase repressor
MMGQPPTISNAEWLVMKVIWAKSSATAAEVVEALEGETAWKPKTIMTLLNRLAKKGALRFKKEGRAYRYFPVIGEAETIKAESRSFVERVYGGALTPMLVSFLEEAELSQEEIGDLKRLLDRRRKR